MRKASTLVGLMLIALGASARAEETAPAPAPPPPAIVIVPVVPVPPPAPAAVVEAAPVPIELSPRRLEVGVTFLGMAAGSLTTPAGAMTLTDDALFAYGVSLSVSYRIIAGLSLGFAPQAIFNVGYKQVGAFGGAPPAAQKEYDLMARIAYAIPVAEAVTLYGEVLPGYSKLGQSSGGNSAGPVVAFDVGLSMAMTDRLFVNLGGGYQRGFQSLTVMNTTYDARVNFARVQLGVGTRF
jgi:Outer membrane protein beta-barrel domain